MENGVNCHGKVMEFYNNMSYLPESLNLLEASFLVHRAPFFRPNFQAVIMEFYYQIFVGTLCAE